MAWTFWGRFISQARYLCQPCDGSALLTCPRIKNPLQADYWQQQACAVMLVIRTSDGEIRWMEVRDWLKCESARRKPVKQIVFEGERFDVMSVRRWREKVLVRGYPAPIAFRAQRSFAGAERGLAWRSSEVGRMTS